jgi:hypothetical protein
MDEPGRGSLDCCRRRASARRTHQGTHHRHLRSPARVSPVKPLDTLANDPVTRAPPQKLRRPFRVMRRRESLTRRSATRLHRTSRPGRTIGPSLDRPAALMGFIPSQVCSRGGWICISAHPGPRAFLIAPSDPINFRRVDSPRPSCVSVREKATANRGRRDVGFWASLPSAVRFAIFSPRRTRARQVLESRSILPWALPLSGMRAHIRASMRARPRVDHQPPDASLDTPHPLMCLCDPSRDVRFSALPPRSRRLL